MKKPELLSPAGNMKTLISVINNGADAVYIGGEEFSARAYAENFDRERLKEASSYCHLYGVKLYVAVNTIIFENEIERCLSYLKYLYEINVDAVIMQDIGMIALAHELIPNLEIHASTQVNTQNDECLKFLKEIGVKRAVLAREMDINSIRNLKTDLDTEIFIHGALCVSYSGRCLFSSLNGGRSGNRGRCTGSCRLPYDIYEDGKKLDIKYPLSTKELCTADRIDEFLKLNVSSLKIEGRMKTPEYAGYVTRVYRRLIDDFFEGGDAKVTKEELVNLAKLYNRKFTNGYLFSDDIYNTSSSNHLGYPLGKCVNVTKNKIYIKLTDDLNMEDGIRFVNSNKGMIAGKIYDKSGKLVSHVNSNDIATIDNKVGLRKNDIVHKTLDRNLLRKINSINSKKIRISFYLKALEGRPLTLTITDGVNSVTDESVILEKAVNRPTSSFEIKEKLSKLGGTPFVANNIEIDVRDVFVPLKCLNELRHLLIQKLIDLRAKKRNNVSFTYKKKKISSDKTNLVNSIGIFVSNETQLNMVMDKADIVYTDDFGLYEKYKYLNIYYKLPSVVKNFKDYHGERLLISELGSLHRYYKDNKIITDYCLNVVNSESVKLLKRYGVQLVTLSPEINNLDILEYVTDTEVFVYGKPELMILEDFYLKGKNIELRDRFNNRYKVIRGSYTRIMHHCNIDRTYEKISSNLRINLEDEDTSKVKKILEKV